MHSNQLFFATSRLFNELNEEITNLSMQILTAISIETIKMCEDCLENINLEMTLLSNGDKFL